MMNEREGTIVTSLQPCIYCGEPTRIRQHSNRRPAHSKCVALRMGEFYTLTEQDVGRLDIGAFGEAWPVCDFIGRVLPSDVGKRVYRRGHPADGHYLTVESTEQRDRRIKVLRS